MAELGTPTNNAAEAADAKARPAADAARTRWHWN